MQIFGRELETGVFDALCSVWCETLDFLLFDFTNF